MTVENISRSISTKECCRPRRGLNPRPPGLQSDGASNWANIYCKLTRIIHFDQFWHQSLQNTLQKRATIWEAFTKGLYLYIRQRMIELTKWHLRLAKTQISLGICPVWSESSLSAQWVAKDPMFLHADSKEAERMPRLICLRWAHVPFCWFCRVVAHYMESSRVLRKL